MLWLGAREEINIVVACHSGFLLNVFNSAIEFPSQAAADSKDDQMQSWFETGIVQMLFCGPSAHQEPPELSWSLYHWSWFCVYLLLQVKCAHFQLLCLATHIRGPHSQSRLCPLYSLRQQRWVVTRRRQQLRLLTVRWV